MLLAAPGPVPRARLRLRSGLRARPGGGRRGRRRAGGRSRGRRRLPADAGPGQRHEARRAVPPDGGQRRERRDGPGHGRWRSRASAACVPVAGWWWPCWRWWASWSWCGPSPASCGPPSWVPSPCWRCWPVVDVAVFPRWRAGPAPGGGVPAAGRVVRLRPLGRRHGGLLALAPRLRTALSRLCSRLPLAPGVLDALAVTVAAQLATAPLVAALGGGVSLAAVPANLLAAPAVPPVTVLGLLAALCRPSGRPALRRSPGRGPGRGLDLRRGARLRRPPAGRAAVAGRRRGGLLLLGAVAMTRSCSSWLRGRVVDRRRREARLVGALLAAVVGVVALRPPAGRRLAAARLGGRRLRCRPGGRAGPGQRPARRGRRRRRPRAGCGRPLPARPRGAGGADALLLTHFHADHVEGRPRGAARAPGRRRCR